MRFLMSIMLALCAGVARAQERLPLPAMPLASMEAFAQPGANWSLASAVLSDRHMRHDLRAVPGTGVLVNQPSPEARRNLFTAWTHGDLELELEFLMPKGSNSGIYLQGRYEVQLLDSWSRSAMTFGDAGGIYQRWNTAQQRGFEGRPPRLNASRAPGLWQSLRILFQAPRFDDHGQKIHHAKVVKVVLNGTVVQENVTVTGPTRAAAFDDEAAYGPLMIQGDHGPVAFRNIRYKAYGADEIVARPVTWREYGEESAQLQPLGEPFQRGEADRLGDHVVRTTGPMAVTFDGTMRLPASGTHRFAVTLDWITGDPHFQGQRIGGAELRIADTVVLVHDRNEPTVLADVDLPTGTHPFSFTVFKTLGRRPPGITLTVEGPSTPVLPLLEPEQKPAAVPHIPVAVGREPVVLRGFVRHDDRKRTHAVSVGDPSGVHYSLDLSTGALLHLWRGPFLNASGMWHNRGHEQVVEPLGSVLTLSGLPAIVSDDLPQFTGYRLDPDGRPVFMYTLGPLQIEDVLRPHESEPYLTRSIVVNGQPETPVFVRTAHSEDIELESPGRLALAGGTWWIEGLPGGELQVPLEFHDGTAQLSYSIVW